MISDNKSPLKKGGLRLKILPSPPFSKEGIKRTSPFGKGGLRGIL